MINIIFFDDDLTDLQRITKYVESVEHKINYDVNVEYCHDEEQMYYILNTRAKKYDIIVTDIKMPGLSGMDIAEKIRDEQGDTIVIFMTAYTEYVYRSFECSAFRYIRKEYMRKELLPALRAACRKIMVSRESYITIKDSQGFQRVKSSDILYFELENRKCIIYTTEERIEAWKNITQIKNELGVDADLFIETYRGCLVNKKYVKMIQKNQNKIILDNHIELPISRRKKKLIEDAMFEYWGKNI